MQIDVLPYPNITGRTDVERLNNLIAYTTQLYNILRVILTSLDTSNLTQDLAQQIEASIKEHQDLSEYSTTAYVDRADEELQGEINALDTKIDDEVETLQENINDKADEDHEHSEYATEEWVEDNFASQSWVEEYVEEYVNSIL